MENGFVLHLYKKRLRGSAFLGNGRTHSWGFHGFICSNLNLHDELQLLETYRRNGDIKLLGKLYEPYMPLVYGLCFKYYKNPERSEDAVMQVFELLVKKLRTHEVTNFKSWLYSVARNHCLMDLRADGKQQHVDIDTHQAESDRVLRQYQERGIQEGQLALMEACIDQLNEEQQRCIRLFYLEQKCYKDVAAETGYDLNKVKSHIQNGKRNLKICMERQSGIEK